MGQQQLLLIVLGVIIVGIAVVVGINLFNANAESSAKDTIVSEATNIGAMAQQYYKKPTSMGGGGNSFSGFSIPSNLKTDSSAAVGFSTPAVSDTQCTFTGTPFTNTGYTWKVNTTVTPTKIKSQIVSQ